MRNCPKLKGMNVSISDDFSKSVVHSRKCLWESAKNEKSSGKRVRLVYDKLYVDGKAYYWDDDTDTRKPCREPRLHDKNSSIGGREKSFEKGNSSDSSEECP
ncbi:hypothetical protein HPB49_007425 [Dermacentor silvarum]|uniref:Uncharacterized protein n=1 Tax=Dermacentor silvarum TaxID=543639 RepID=A0ACB8DWP1_DERSI|nr:hypothetical protein HPB49_007425 [Dermacentor silvarum]